MIRRSIRNKRIRLVIYMMPNFLSHICHALYAQRVTYSVTDKRERNLHETQVSQRRKTNICGNINGQQYHLSRSAETIRGK